MYRKKSSRRNDLNPNTVPNAQITARQRDRETEEREREREGGGEEESTVLSADKFSNIKSIFVRYKCQNIGKIHSNKPSTRYCRYRGTWSSLCRENENVVTKNTNNCYKESLIFVEDLSIKHRTLISIFPFPPFSQSSLFERCLRGGPGSGRINRDFFIAK